MAVTVETTCHSVDSTRSLSRSLMKRTALEGYTTSSKSKENQQAFFSCMISFTFRLFALAILVGISIVFLLHSQFQSSLRQSLPLEWSENNILPGVPDADVMDKDGSTGNLSLLMLSAIEPSQTGMQTQIKKLLDPNLPDILNKFYGSGMRGRSFVPSMRQKELMGIPPYIANRRAEPFWPDFQHRLHDWAFTRRFDPTVMKSLMSDIKAPLDKYYKSDSKGSKYKRCAVVGNSGILLSKQYGNLIDSNDMVMRLNNAGTSTYESFVGRKTTISFVNSNILHNCYGRSNCRCPPYGPSVPTVLYICQVVHLMDVAYCSKERNVPLLVTDPRFDTFLARLVKWYSLKDFVENTNHPATEWDKFHDSIYFHYSSGLQAVFLALGICDEVNLYGFGKNSTSPHHYHTRQKAELDLHDYEAEYKLYDDLVNNPQSIPFLSESGIDIPPVHIYR